MSQKRKRRPSRAELEAMTLAEQMEALEKQLNDELDAAFRMLATVGEAEQDGDGWRYRVVGLPADADESDALAVVRRRAAELEALEQAEAEQAELDHAEAVLGWL